MKIKRVLLVVGALSNCVLLSGCGGYCDTEWRYDAREILVKISEGNWRFFIDEDHNRSLMYKEEYNSKWHRIHIKESYNASEIVYQNFPYQINKY